MELVIGIVFFLLACACILPTIGYNNKDMYDYNLKKRNERQRKYGF